MHRTGNNTGGKGKVAIIISNVSIELSIRIAEETDRKRATMGLLKGTICHLDERMYQLLCPKIALNLIRNVEFCLRT